jgi:hypothetical protein
MKAMRNRLAILGTLAVLAGCVVTTTTSHAEAQARPRTDKSKLKEAVKSFKAAQAKFDAKDYAGALELYTKAEGLLPGAKPKFMIAQSIDLAGKTADAIAAYQTFLDSKPNPKKHQKRIDAASKRIGELQATLPGTVTVTVAPADATATISVDGSAVEGNNTLSLAPGDHEVVVSAEGYQDSSHTVKVEAGSEQTLEVKLEASAAAAEPAGPLADEPADGAGDEVPADGAERSRVPAYVTLGVAGAGAVLGAVFGVQALGAKSDFDAAPTIDNADKAERSALIADMSFGIALTFGITGTVLLFSDDGESDESAAVPVLVPFASFKDGGAGLKGGGMAATWTF